MQFFATQNNSNTLESRWANFVLLRNIIFYITASEKMEQKTLLTTITQRHAYIFYPLPYAVFSLTYAELFDWTCAIAAFIELEFLAINPKKKQRQVF